MPNQEVSPDDIAEETKKICWSCPVRETCLEYALENDLKYGVWGGLTPKERVREKRNRRTRKRRETFGRYSYE